MKHISNEEKAREIAKKYETPCHGIGDCEFEAYQSAFEAMEWKEQQLIDRLREVLSAHMHGGEIDEVLAELDEKIKGEQQP